MICYDVNMVGSVEPVIEDTEVAEGVFIGDAFTFAKGRELHASDGSTKEVGVGVWFGICYELGFI